jgi:protein-S-isoprenylcysteine O-methyltransferase Ste14
VSAWRHALVIVLLPGTVTVLVPALILAGGDSDVGWGLDGALAALPAAAGGALIGAGLGLWAWSVLLFARIGKGTLAPWDPTRRLVVIGPYRYVRNPMITGVLVVLLGEAALFGSLALLVWTGVFFVMNAVWFTLGEEPGLVRRFGGEYEEYRRNVPRWIPRRTPWSPPTSGPPPSSSPAR